MIHGTEDNTKRNLGATEKTQSNQQQRMSLAEGKHFMKEPEGRGKRGGVGGRERGARKDLTTNRGFNTLS